MPVPRTLWIIPGLVAAFAAPAAAQDDDARAPLRQAPDRVIAYAPESGTPSWLATHLEHVRLHSKRGFAYTRAVDHGERGLEWSVQGPAVGRKKAVGLGFELRF